MLALLSNDILAVVPSRRDIHKELSESLPEAGP